MRVGSTALVCACVAHSTHPRCSPIHAQLQPARNQSRRHRRQHLQPAGTPPPPPAGAATNLPPAAFGGVEEDHAYEQYFFDEATRESLCGLMARFQRPLLLCVPSLAVLAEESGQPYLLLEKDERFSFLTGFRQYDLLSPTPAPTDVPCDAVIADPPFANIELWQLRKALACLYSSMPSRPPLYLAFHSKRAEELLAELSEFGLARGRKLGYMSVKERTQRHLFLYEPASDL